MYPQGRGRGNRGIRGTGSRGRNMPRSNKHNVQSIPTVSAHNTSGFIHGKNCCNSKIGINLELTGSEIEFLAKLKSMWNMLKKSPPVVNLLHQHFNESGNPYEQALRLIYNCQEFNNAKPKTLPFFIIEELKSISYLNRQNAQYLTTNLKLNAFHLIIKQNSQSLTKLIVDVFEMAHSNEIFLPLIHCMLDKKNYKDACQYAVLFKLQDKFQVEDILLPLILQDKIPVVDEFLAASPRHQNELITLLDSVLGKPSVKEALYSYALKYGIPEVKMDKLHGRPLKKLITRLVKMYKISQNLTPNLNKRRNEGALQFLIHKRFVENSFGDESWREMVQEAVGNDEELQRELVVQVSIYGDNNQALEWANFYNVDQRYWPASLLDMVKNGTKTPQSSQQQQQQQDIYEDWDIYVNDNKEQENVQYHKFSLSLDRIILVDTEVKFKDFIDSILKDADIVGIDCEWKPNFGSHENELALMQIATRSNVYIIDILKLGSNVSHLWKQVSDYLFHNGDIIKLAFGFSSDMAMIKQTLPELDVSHKNGFIDLLTVWKHLDKYPTVKLPYDLNGSGPSFSSLIQQCFGLPLDKSDQFSNWEKRPLRESQLIYAANDAYSLIQAFDVIKMCCENADISFDDVCNSVMSKDKGHHKKKSKKSNPRKQRQQLQQPVVDIPQPPCFYTERIPVANLKVVCDTMLQGLGKNLRRCGVNTVILDNNMDHMECVRYYQNDKRFILTRGSIFNKLYGYVPAGYCLKIKSDNVDEQLKEVLDYYKVDVTKSDVFSICQACNGDSYVELPQSKILLLKKAPIRYSNYYINDDDDDDLEPTGFSSDDDDDDIGPVISAHTPWNLESYNGVNMGEGKTRLGAYIQIDSIPGAVLEKTKIFYICEKCGKVYWDGSHFNRVLNGRLQGIVQ